MAGRAGRKAPAGTPERAAEGPGPEPDARASFGQCVWRGANLTKTPWLLETKRWDDFAACNACVGVASRRERTPPYTSYACPWLQTSFPRDAERASDEEPEDRIPHES